MTRERPQNQGFIYELHGLPLGMASQRHFVRIQVPGTCPMAHILCSFVLSMLVSQ